VGYGRWQGSGKTGGGVRDARVGVTRTGEGDRAHAEKIFPATKLHEALAEADYVLIAAPETAATRHLLGAAEIVR